MSPSTKRQKYRGKRTHGRGAGKKGRGAGSRGGRGMAGSGKKGQQKVTILLKKYGGRPIGKRGFTPPASSRSVYESINVGDIESRLSSLVEKGFARLEKGVYVVDLEAAGYEKVLGGGRVSKKMRVRARMFTQRAIQKIESAGGSVERIGETEEKE